MRRSPALLVAVLAICGTLTAASAAAGAPRLQIVRASPVTVRGTGFVGRERIRLTVRTTARTVTRSIHAGANGAFTVRFAGVVLGRCGDAAVTAVGNRGDVAQLSRHRQLASCNPG
jgi:hypothetical protein